MLQRSAATGSLRHSSSMRPRRLVNNVHASAGKSSSLLRDAPPELRYFDARGAAEVIRTLFAIADIPYKDTRYTFGMVDGKPKVSDLHGTDKALGLFLPNLDRLPVLTLSNGVTIGQSKTIERFVARECGFAGTTTIEEAEVDCYCEHIRDMSLAWGKVRGSPMAAPDEATIILKDKWYAEGFPNWMTKMEKVTGAGGHCVGKALTFADILLYVTITQGFDDDRRTHAAYEKCPNITAVVKMVGQLPAMQKWLNERPKNVF